VSLLWTGPVGAPVLVLAHGAGAPMDSPFLQSLAGLLADEGVRVGRFEFAYMAGRRSGRRKPPPRADVLDAEFLAVLERVPGRVCIGGKSMGSRAACRVAGRLGVRRVAGVVCFGFPFHPPGKPEAVRNDLAAAGDAPVLVIQGERDPFGTRAEVEAMRLQTTVTLSWIEMANHDLAPPKTAAVTKPEALALAARSAANFVRQALE
jgi:hypothetical protein